MKDYNEKESKDFLVRPFKSTDPLKYERSCSDDKIIHCILVIILVTMT